MKPITTDGTASSTSGSGHDPGRLVRIVMTLIGFVVVFVFRRVFGRERLVVEALLAVEDQEVHAKRIERRHEHADHDRA